MPHPPDHSSPSPSKPGICPAYPGSHPACLRAQALETLLQQLRTPAPGESQLQLLQASRLYFPSHPNGRDYLSILLPTWFQFLATLPTLKIFSVPGYAVEWKVWAEGSFPNIHVPFLWQRLERNGPHSLQTADRKQSDTTKVEQSSLNGRMFFCQNQEHFLPIPE